MSTIPIKDLSDIVSELFSARKRAAPDPPDRWLLAPYAKKLAAPDPSEPPAKKRHVKTELSDDPLLILELRRLNEVARDAGLVISPGMATLQDMMISFCTEKDELLKALITKILIRSSSSSPSRGVRCLGALSSAEVLRHAHEIVQMMHPQSLRKVLDDPFTKSTPGTKEVENMCFCILLSYNDYKFNDRIVVLFALVRCMRASLDATSLLLGSSTHVSLSCEKYHRDSVQRLSNCLETVFKSVPSDDYPSLAAFRDGSNTLLDELGLIQENYDQNSGAVCACAMYGKLRKPKRRELTLTATKVFGGRFESE